MSEYEIVKLNRLRAIERIERPLADMDDGTRPAKEGIVLGLAHVLARRMLEEDGRPTAEHEVDRLVERMMLLLAPGGKISHKQ